MNLIQALRCRVNRWLTHRQTKQEARSLVLTVTECQHTGGTIRGPQRRFRRGGMVRRRYETDPRDLAPCDAVCGEFADEINERPVREPPDDGEYNYAHERDLATTMRNFRAGRASQVENIGYDEMLRRHYTLGSPHPDDRNYPISKWNDYD